ncbi:hypothetical protein M433DRAFT_361280 [Acidomyces richmondensis BFW]|nr:MAG: hypothetical protein FE78DRAFT_194663 [Acidomyces sp. 'richmondensis']KYG49042.1 hypothetical protein M433DRAFT_361280 [Acidomyces richmondensis BFW]
MPIMRNPFRRQDENARPITTHPDQKPPAVAQPIDIREKEPTEYKLSEINDSGVYLPPSPPHERRSFWTTSSRSTTSSSTVPSRTAFNEHEPFNISRESFESYRRSFDISARSPVVHHDRPPRASLDSRTFLPPPPPPRTSNSYTRPLPARTQEEAVGFEEVDIGGADKSAPQQPPPPKKRGLFSRITDGGDRSERPGSADGKTGGAWHLPGRRRGHSGQGSELGVIAPKREGIVSPMSPTTMTGVAGWKREGQQMCRSLGVRCEISTSTPGRPRRI